MFKYPGQRNRKRNNARPAPSGPPPPMSELSRWFDYYDSDRSGFLDKEEVVSALVQTSSSPSQEQSVREMVYSVWPAFDHDGSGTIDKGEFCAPGGMGESLLAAVSQSRAQSQHQNQQPQAYVPTPSAPPAYVPQAQPYQPQPQQQHAYVPQSQPQVYVPQAQAAYVPASNYGTSQQQQYQNSTMTSPSSSSSSTSSSYWECPRCTFVNKRTEQTCKACAGPAPPGTAAATATAVAGGGHYSQQQQQQQQQHQKPPVVVQGTYVPVPVPVPTAPTAYANTTAATTATSYNSSSKTTHHEPSSRPPAFQSWEQFRGHSYDPPPIGMHPVPPSDIASSYSSNVASVPTSRRRKALIIGINYTGTRAALRGCVNDAQNIKKLLIKQGFKNDSTHMVMLYDEGNRDRSFLPTRSNILRAMQWLVQGVSPGDVLFFHYSGHGAQVPDKTGHEADGFNETILPLDYKDGQITDDVLWGTMVWPLPSGVRLTAIMDCCHSGTGLDLPFEYKNGQWIEDINPAHSKGDVILFSGCEDAQTSADAYDKYRGAGGAMTQSFIDAYEQNPMCTYTDLMAAIHRHLQRRRFIQRPQLTTSQRFDVRHRVFSFVDGIEPNRNREIGRKKTRHVRPGRTGGGGQGMMGDLLFGGAAIVGLAAFADLFS